MRLSLGLAAVGSTVKLNNSATTRLRTFAHRQPSRDRRETVDFTTRADRLDRERTRVTTTAKDGHSSLREMAFPELGETIDYLVKATGEVVRAGRYPPTSAFFIPALPLPRGEVAVGDTWEMDHDWTSGVDHFPLRLEVIGILKEISRCTDGHVCADVEVSGHILLRVAPDNAGARFDSRVRGRAVFDVSAGEVRWAHMLSREEIGLGPEISLIESCLISRAAPAHVACEPDFAAAIAVPRI